MTQPITTTNRQRSILCQSRGWKLWDPGEAMEWVAGKASLPCPETGGLCCGTWTAVRDRNQLSYRLPRLPVCSQPFGLPACWQAAGQAAAPCWSIVEVCQEAQWNVGLSQVSAAHTCRCLEKKNSCNPVPQAGQWQGLDSQQTAMLACWPIAGLADQGCCASSCFTGAALVGQRVGRAHWTLLQTPGKAGWADLCYGGPQLLLGGSRAEGEEVSCPKHLAERASAHQGIGSAPSPNAGNSNKKKKKTKGRKETLSKLFSSWWSEWVQPLSHVHGST